jgi:opacity protein-like surface antigen
VRSILNSLVLALITTLTCLSARADFPEGRNALLVNFGFAKGGPALGIDYEYGFAKTYGLGGYFRIDPSSKNPAEDGLTTFGAFIRPHFSRQNWDFYLSPGFGFLSYKEISGANNDENDYTMMGPSLGIGLLYEFTTNLSVGAEQMSYYGWFGKSTHIGFEAQDLMAKFRFIF